MIKRLKSTFKRVLLKRGFTLNKIHANPIFNDDPFKAVQDSIEGRNPVFFDLGVKIAAINSTD
ncbi:hypothetical protein [Patiriisocius sp. Uisw_017]|jgi:hypothetical protein|uniref:hypothetical protein n=1 Tax=Patiriisocius sp. Uisw_017 TaxID=3230968 RepID=UPI0039EAF9D4